MRKHKFKKTPFSNATLEDFHFISFFSPSLFKSPLPQSDLQAQGFPQESFPGLHRVVLLDPELISVEDSTNSGKQLHLCNVATNTGAGTNAERGEGCFLSTCQTLGVPSFRIKGLRIRTPDSSRMVDCVRGDGEDIACLEDMAGDCDWRSTGRDLARKAHSSRAVDAHRLPDNPLQTR